MRHALIALAGLVLAGCGTIPPTITAGDSFSTSHDPLRFKDAAEGAQQYCATRGKAAKHLGTDGGSIFAFSVSRFECVAK